MNLEKILDILTSFIDLDSFKKDPIFKHRVVTSISKYPSKKL